MRAATMSLCLTALVCLTPRARAANYVFSSFQCDPVSCVEQGPASVQETALVSFNGDCTGGVIAGITGKATITIGVPTACSQPYIPHAQVDTSETKYLDDCGDAFYVSYVTAHGEVFTASGNLVYHLDVTSGCDGSTSGPTKFGTKPC